MRFARRLVGDDTGAAGAAAAAAATTSPAVDPLACNAQPSARDMFVRLGFVPFPVVGGVRTHKAGPGKRVRTVHVDVNDALADNSVLFARPGFYGDAPVTTLGHVLGANPRFAHFWRKGKGCAPMEMGGGVVRHLDSPHPSLSF